MVRTFDDTGYWAIVLGGSSGLGLATAQKLARHGMNLCLVHRTRRQDLAAFDEAVTQLRQQSVGVLTYNLDATHPGRRADILTDVAQQLPTGHRVRALIHSLAKGNLKPLQSASEPTLSPDDFRLTIDAMAISLYDWTKAVAEAGLLAPDARVISFTSEGSHRAWPAYAAVSAAKAALEAITRSIALEMAPLGIRANCLMAGVTDTPALRLIPGHETLLENSRQRNPFARQTTPTDVANAAYLLCTDEAAWINGAVIPVNGGEHLQ